MLVKFQWDITSYTKSLGLTTTNNQSELHPLLPVEMEDPVAVQSVSTSGSALLTINFYYDLGSFAAEWPGEVGGVMKFWVGRVGHLYRGPYDGFIAFLAQWFEFYGGTDQ